MSGPIRALTVFCGSSAGADSRHAEATRVFGRLLAARGIILVYGGGRVGLMGEVADAALAAGGSVTGVITRQLVDKEVGHTGLTELLVVDSMHERKLAMADRADAFVALPGGFGTLEELFEVVTWSQLGIHAKPVGLLDGTGFYRPLLAFLDSAVDAGFLRPAHRQILLSDPDGPTLLDRLAAWTPVDIPKWVGLDQR
ncbi:MAG: TIGR00730 family Rossman fold protein [Acidimicrobiales bacterium]